MDAYMPISAHGTHDDVTAHSDQPRFITTVTLPLLETREGVFDESWFQVQKLLQGLACPVLLSLSS